MGAGLGGCGNADRPATSAGPKAGPVKDEPVEPAFVPRTAERCTDCHQEIREQWGRSGHGNALSSPLMKAMLAEVGDEGADCMRCHAPLVAAFGADARAAAEGITCEACHLITQVEARRSGAGYELDLAGGTEYGPLCDAKDHYFHRMGCAPVYAKSEFCGGCHLWYKGHGDSVLPVFTDFEEWVSSGLEEADMQCQDCHMPTKSGHAAAGSAQRKAVAHHGTMGDDERLRSNAVTLDLEATRSGNTVALGVTLKNRAGGHAIPTGLPARRLVLVVRVTQAGAELERSRQVYGRIMQDADGAEVPFYAAARVAQDNRLQPGAPREEHFELTVPAGADIEVALSWEAYPATFRARLKLQASPKTLLAQARLTPGAGVTKASSVEVP